MATYLKKAFPLNPFDFIAARALKVEADGPLSWGTHLFWWLDGGWRNMWFYLSGRQRVAYVRVDHNKYVSIVVTGWYRRSGIGEFLLSTVGEQVKGVLRAKIARENAASRLLFVRAGYTYRHEETASSYVVLERK